LHQYFAAIATVHFSKFLQTQKVTNNFANSEHHAFHIAGWNQKLGEGQVALQGDNSETFTEGPLLFFNRGLGSPAPWLRPCDIASYITGKMSARGKK
jgi:hypothetical protein